MKMSVKVKIPRLDSRFRGNAEILAILHTDCYNTRTELTNHKRHKGHKENTKSKVYFRTGSALFSHSP